jgi:predicted transposase/invertase (TIGR01784 family)
VVVSQEEIERARQVSEEKYQLDLQSKLVQARREGRQEGLQQRKLEIARNIKVLGVPIEKIAQATGLTERQINEL